jgi:hypothetical protein
MRNRFQFFRANRFQVSKILTHGDVALRGCTPALRLYGKVGNMNALPSTMKWLGLGFGVYSLATLACSAEASSPPPQQGSTQNQSGNGTGGTPAIGTAGSTALPTAGTTATGPQGGTTAVGTAGTTAKDVPLIVLNNTTVTGLAQRAAQRFEQGGWTVSRYANYQNDIVSTCAYYDPADAAAKAAAEALQQQYPVIKRVKQRFAELPSGPVVVVLTPDYS